MKLEVRIWTLNLILVLTILFSLSQVLNNGGLIYGTDGWSQNLVSESITNENYINLNYFNNEKVKEYAMFPGYPLFIANTSLLSGQDSSLIIAIFIPIICAALWILFGFYILKRIFKEQSLVYLGLIVLSVSAPFLDRIMRSSYDTLGLIFFILGVLIIYRFILEENTIQIGIIILGIIILLSFIHHLSTWLTLLVFLGAILYSIKEKLGDLKLMLVVFSLSFFLFFLKLVMFNGSLFSLISKYFNGTFNFYSLTLAR